MIPLKQLSLTDIFTDCQNQFDSSKRTFLEFLYNTTMHPDEIAPLSFVFHFLPPTASPVGIISTQCLRLCLFSSQLPSWSYSSDTHRNCGIPAISMLSPMPLSSPTSNRISCQTYNPCSTSLPTWRHRSVSGSIRKSLPYCSLTLSVSKHRAQK